MAKRQTCNEKREQSPLTDLHRKAEPIPDKHAKQFDGGRTGFSTLGLEHQSIKIYIHEEKRL